nr:hypothetical protein [Tanacetum cinerariifolium]
TNPKEDLKGITTQSGTTYQGPTIPTTTSSPVVERETKATKDTVHPTNNGSTKDVQPPVVLTESLILNSEPVISPIIEPKIPPKRTTTPMSDAFIKVLVARSMANALTDNEASRSRNGDDSHASGTGSRRTERTTRECTYSDFLKCQPLIFKGTKGAIGLTQWFERMRFAFHINKCIVGNQIKFATCTLLGGALTGKIKKLETEIKNLKVKGTDVVSYTQCFQELALMCGRMFLEESDQVEKYVEGHPDMIQGSVMASKPKTMLEENEIANDLMDQKVHTFVDRQAKNKRKLDDNTRNN